MNNKQQLRSRRQHRIRTKLSGTAVRPRVSVFRSCQNSYVQFIDDEKGLTLLGLDDRKFKKAGSKEAKEFSTKVSKSYELGQKAAQLALQKDIKEVVFDRSGYKYHGRVKAIAEGMRQAGLKL